MNLKKIFKDSRLTSLVLKNRTKNAQLEDNDMFKRLRELEKKMQMNENNIFS